MVAVESLVGVQLESETKIKKMKFEFLKFAKLLPTSLFFSVTDVLTFVEVKIGQWFDYS